MKPDELALRVVLYVAFIFSATFHEAAHAWAAKRGGDLTAYRGGQVTLDPRPHLQREPFGMVVIPIISLLVSGFPLGFASAPYDPHWARRHPHRAAWMALAGPGANFALLLTAAAGVHLGLAIGAFHAPDAVSLFAVTGAAEGRLAVGMATLLSVGFSLNLLLLTLNLIPVPPLDGSAAVALLMSEDTAVRYQDLLVQPALGWVGILLVWSFFGKIFDPVFTLSLRLLYPALSYG